MDKYSGGNSGSRRRRKRNRREGLFLKIGICLAAAALTVGLWWSRPGRLFGGIESPIGGAAPARPAVSSAGAGTDAAGETAWSLILVNRWNAIPNGYGVETTGLPNGERVDSRIYPALQEMFNAARAEGVYPVVASGYRTTEEQQSIMDERVAAYKAEGYSDAAAKTEAEAWVALPGTSEHQIGLGVDINADGIHSSGNEVYTWLDQNGYRFGFIHRYPPDKTDLTGVSSEPWHYRYVGVEAAASIYRDGLCLEEYLENMK